MNRNMAIILAVIITGALVLGAIYIPVYLEDIRPMNASVEFYDKDGELIATSTPMFISAGGAEVETMVVKAKWTVDTANIDPATFNAQVDVEISVLNWDANVYEYLDTKSLDSSVMIQESYIEVHTWTLATLLQEYMTATHKADGWSLRIQATLTPTAKDYDGVAVTPDPPTQDAPVVTVGLTWVDTIAAMTIISFETNRWLPLVP